MEITGRETGFETALAQAAAVLREADRAALSARCRVGWDGDSLTVAYFNKLYQVALATALITPPGLSLQQQVLILHYLTWWRSSGASPGQGDYLPYHELPGGRFYAAVFQRNGPARLLARFAGELERLVQAGIALGGSPVPFGDLAVRVPLFPTFDALVVCHRADEEFPADIQILFRDTISGFLPLEDIAVLGGWLAGYLAEVKK